MQEDGAEIAQKPLPGDIVGQKLLEVAQQL
jgi:hypothetical protein